MEEKLQEWEPVHLSELDKEDQGGELIHVDNEESEDGYDFCRRYRYQE